MDYLSLEELVHILKYLNGQELVICRLVHPYWKNAIDNLLEIKMAPLMLENIKRCVYYDIFARYDIIDKITPETNQIEEMVYYASLYDKLDLLKKICRHHPVDNFQIIHKYDMPLLFNRKILKWIYASQDKYKLLDYACPRTIYELCLEYNMDYFVDFVLERNIIRKDMFDLCDFHKNKRMIAKYHPMKPIEYLYLYKDKNYEKYSIKDLCTVMFFDARQDILKYLSKSNDWKGTQISYLYLVNELPLDSITFLIRIVNYLEFPTGWIMYDILKLVINTGNIILIKKFLAQVQPIHDDVYFTHYMKMSTSVMLFLLHYHQYDQKRLMKTLYEYSPNLYDIDIVRALRIYYPTLHIEIPNNSMVGYSFKIIKKLIESGLFNLKNYVNVYSSTVIEDYPKLIEYLGKETIPKGEHNIFKIIWGFFDVDRTRMDKIIRYLWFDLGLKDEQFNEETLEIISPCIGKKRYNLFRNL